MTRYLAELQGFGLSSKPNGCLLKGLKQEGGICHWAFLTDEGADVKPG